MRSMSYRRMSVAGGLCFIVGAVAFVLVFGYLAINFDYPAVLDGKPARPATSEPPEAPPSRDEKNKGGRPLKASWDAVWVHICRLVYEGEDGGLSESFERAFYNTARTTSPTRPMPKQSSTLLAGYGAS